MNHAMEALYYSFHNKKKKERFDIILEPLQSIIQLSFISLCPVGTKLTIQNNLLYIQQPTYSQGMVRWYNSDTKDDLFYLFNVFCRFNKFYDYLKDKPETRELYHLLIEMAKEGINKLVRTYNETDKVSLLHTLQMYKTILDNPEILNRKEPQLMENPFQDKKASKKSNKKPEKKEEITSPKSNIDDIFIRITDLYSNEHLKVIYNTLHICREDKTNYNAYIEGLNKVLEPTNIQIKKWIDDNIIF